MTTLHFDTRVALKRSEVASQAAMECCLSGQILCYECSDGPVRSDKDKGDNKGDIVSYKMRKGPPEVPTTL